MTIAENKNSKSGKKVNKTKLANSVYETVGELMEAIALQIHYYNHKRIHTAIKMPPAVFYQRFQMNNFRSVGKNVVNRSLGF